MCCMMPKAQKCCLQSTRDEVVPHRHLDKGINRLVGGIYWASAHPSGRPLHVVWAAEADCSCGKTHRAADHLQGTTARLCWTRPFISGQHYWMVAG